MNEPRIQVEAAHYDFATYLTEPRWRAYYHQVAEAVAGRPRSVLIIGKGDGIVAAILRQVLGPAAEIVTFDFDAALKPDIVGDVRRIDEILQGQKFDCVLCCQVLEHLEFRYFEEIVRRIGTCTTRRLILSLPCATVRFALIVGFDLPRIHEKRALLKLGKFWKRRFDGQHHWEISAVRYSKRKVENVLRKHFDVVKKFHVTGFEYHYFFILQPPGA